VQPALPVMDEGTCWLAHCDGNRAQVATRAAIDMAADKLICMTVPETQPIALPLWTPLADAERVLSSLIADRMPNVALAPRAWAAASRSCLRTEAVVTMRLKGSFGLCACLLISTFGALSAALIYSANTLVSR